MGNKTMNIQKWLRSAVSFLMSLSISSAPAAAQTPMAKGYLALEHDLEKGLTAERAQQILRQVYTSKDDQIVLDQIFAQAPRNHTFKIKSARMHTETLELVMLDGKKITIDRIFDQTPVINGRMVKLHGVPFRQAINDMQAAISVPDENVSSLFNDSVDRLIGLILPQAHAYFLLFPILAASGVTASFFLGRGVKNAMYGRKELKEMKTSTEEEVAMLVRQCRDERKGKTPYQESKAFNNLKKIESADRAIVDSVNLKTVGQCNSEHAARLARIAGLEIVPDGENAFCEWTQKWMTCMAEYRGDQASPIVTEVANGGMGSATR